MEGYEAMDENIRKQIDIINQRIEELNSL